MALILGTAIGQLITLGVTPFLARFYSSEDFGYLSLVLSAASIVTPAAALRLESALMLPRSTRNATALLATGAVSALVLSAASVVVLEVLFSMGLLANMGALAGFSWWVAAIVLTTAVFTLLSQFALRAHRYGAVARRSVYQSVLAAGAQVGLGAIAPSPLALIGGYTLGRLAGIAPLVLAVRTDLRRFRVVDARRILRHYWRFPALFAPSAMLNAAGLVLPVLFVGTWYSVADAGQWAMAERILAAPLVLVATAISQVVEAKMADSHRTQRGDTARYYLNVSGVLVVIAAVVVLAIVLVGPWLLPIFLGPGWGRAADIVIAMSPMLATRLIATPLSKVLVVAQKALTTLALDVVRVVLVVSIAVMVVALNPDVVTAAWWFSAALSVVYVVTWMVGLAAARGESKS
jgi:O-antigen/teichoic acid export membrane protein